MNTGKGLILFIFLIFSNLNYSQLKEILVLNEGSFDYLNNQILVPVTIGSFHLDNQSYYELNQISGARFASDIVLDGTSYWVAADQFINQYDIRSHQLLNSIQLTGVRKLACYKNLLIVSRGEYLKQLDSYVQIYNKQTLKLVAEIPYSILPFTTESIIIKDNMAYIAVNNGFDFGHEVGKIIKYDLNAFKVIETYDLGVDGKNPENLMLKDNTLISLNNKNFTGSSISLINLEQARLETYNLSNINSLCGTSVLAGESVIYQEIDKTEVGQFDLQNKQSGFYKDLGRSYYGMNFDPASKLLCAGETDFKTVGKVYIYDNNLNELYQFKAGVTPAYFAFVDESILANKELESLAFDLSPNPITNKLRVISQESIASISILDIYGRTLKSANAKFIELSELQPGSYLICVKAQDKIGYKRFVKSSH